MAWYICWHTTSNLVICGMREYVHILIIRLLCLKNLKVEHLLVAYAYIHATSNQFLVVCLHVRVPLAQPWPKAQPYRLVSYPLSLSLYNCRQYPSLSLHHIDQTQILRVGPTWHSLTSLSSSLALSCMHGLLPCSQPLSLLFIISLLTLSGSSHMRVPPCEWPRHPSQGAEHVT
jgi:hypothetical protein